MLWTLTQFVIGIFLLCLGVFVVIGTYTGAIGLYGIANEMLAEIRRDTADR